MSEATGRDDPLDRLPKVDLHCHVEGTMRRETVIELAAHNNIELPTSDPAELYHYSSLDSFLEVFWLVQSLLVDRDDWTRLAYEAVVDSAAHGLVYGEFFFTPARHLEQGQFLADIVAGLDEGFAAAEQETGAQVRLIADMDRAHGPGAALAMVSQLIDLRRAGATGMDRVIGVGMDSTEEGVNPADYVAAYELAERAGLRRTAHQGETTPPWTIQAALDVLRCERIDHGLSVLDDLEVTRRMAAEKIPLTVCPTSNIKIANHVERLELHPYAEMRDAGLLATLNTDDPALTELDLGIEYRAVHDAFGYEFADMVAIAGDGIDASWLDDDGKRRLHARLRSAAEELQDSG
ncbi:MAG: adenosine deaminase [Actinobacteria bacterium]|nr:adenosine deaminase [Actinomycetota bacterium]